MLDRASIIGPFRYQKGVEKFWSIFSAQPKLTSRSAPSEHRMSDRTSRRFPGREDRRTGRVEHLPHTRTYRSFPAGDETSFCGYVSGHVLASWDTASRGWRIRHPSHPVQDQRTLWKHTHPRIQNPRPWLEMFRPASPILPRSRTDAGQLIYGNRICQLRLWMI